MDSSSQHLSKVKNTWVINEIDFGVILSESISDDDLGSAVSCFNKRKNFWDIAKKAACLDERLFPFFNNLSIWF